MLRQRTLDDVDLVSPAGIVETGPTAGEPRRGNSGRGRNHRGGGSAVGDSHLADANKRHARGGKLVCDFNPNFDCAASFVTRHRIAVEKILRARPDAMVRDAVKRICAGIGFNPDIDHSQFDSRSVARGR